MNWHEWATSFVLAFNWFVLGYFTALNGIYLILFLISLREVWRFVRRTFFSDYRQIMQSELTLPISVLIPAFNEEKTIVETVKSLQMVNYGEFEIIVINDGSTDGTMRELIEAYDLRRVDRVYRKSLDCSPVRGIYASLEYPNLQVIDKEKGGKADSLNSGINLARYPLFCSVDADSIIEDNALLRVVKPFMETPEETVAVGGIVRIANGCTVRDGRVVDVRLPNRPLVIFQVIEYLRAFLTGRVGWSALRSLLIISGAFGLYRRKEVVEIGGYDPDSDTEDLELVVRLHRHMRLKKEKYRILFVPDPVCWTEVPSSWKALRQQRNRWHRGLLQSLWRYRTMCFNPRYGVLGAVAMPYFIIFEMFGPFIEVAGYAAVILSYLLGLLRWEFFLLFVTLAFLFGVFLSVAAVLLEEISFRRYPSWEDLVKLLIFSVIENLWYRQVLAVYKVKSFIDFVRRSRKWGEMDRKGFARGVRGGGGTEESPAGAQGA